MSVVSVNDPRLASRVGTRTWGARLSGSPIITALTYGGLVTAFVQ